MDKRSAQVEAEIDRRIGATLPADSPNGITAAELRDLVVEYLQEKDAEVEAIPHIAGEPHWNLWMRDARLEDALFTVLVFEASGIAFFCGIGNRFDIQGYDFTGDVKELPAEMERLFAIPQGVLHLDRRTAEAWLGRGW
jgi:hypothetical protein